MDSLKRSIAKTLSWRFVGTLLTTILLYIATGQLAIAIGFGLIDTLVKFVAYFIHERVWNKIKFGRDNVD